MINLTRDLLNQALSDCIKLLKINNKIYEEETHNKIDLFITNAHVYRRLEINKENQPHTNDNDGTIKYIINKNKINNFIKESLGKESSNGISVNSEREMKFSIDEINLLVNSLNSYKDFIKSYSLFVSKEIESIDSGEFNNFKSYMECYRDVTKAMTNNTFAIAKISTNFIEKNGLLVVKDPLINPKNLQHCFIIDKNDVTNDIINGITKAINDITANGNHNVLTNKLNDFRIKLTSQSYDMNNEPFKSFINNVSSIIYDDFKNKRLILKDSEIITNDVVTISNFKEIKEINVKLQQSLNNEKDKKNRQTLNKIVNTSPKDFNFIVNFDDNENLILIRNKIPIAESFNIKSFREYIKTKLLY